MKRMMGLLLLGSLMAWSSPAEGKLIHKDGILRVIEQTNHYGKGKDQPYYYLMKYDTHFGLQFLKPKNGNEDFSTVPTCYHHNRSPVGIVMEALKASATLPSFAVVGMHVGTMAAYARPGQEVHFYESNPKIIELSQPKKGDPYFTYIQDAKKRGAKVQTFPGKQRDMLKEKALKNSYQVIVVEGCLRARLEDMCVELMTKEGMALLLDNLTETGILCYHTSNRYLDMVPVITDVAKELGCVTLYGHDLAPDNPSMRKDFAAKLPSDDPSHFASYWVMVARNKNILETLQPPPNYQELLKQAKLPVEPYWQESQGTGKHIWTDKSKHSLKGLFRSDPLVGRVGSVFATYASAGNSYLLPLVDSKTAMEIVSFTNQLHGGFFGLANVVAELRAGKDVTIEDLQKGWPEGY